MAASKIRTFPSSEPVTSAPSTDSGAAERPYRTGQPLTFAPRPSPQSGVALKLHTVSPVPTSSVYRPAAVFSAGTPGSLIGANTRLPSLAIPQWTPPRAVPWPNRFCHSTAPPLSGSSAQTWPLFCPASTTSPLPSGLRMMMAPAPKS